MMIPEKRIRPWGNRADQYAASDASSVALPAAHVFWVIPTEKTRMVYVVCPYCRHVHAHGWPNSFGDAPGTVSTYCMPGAGRSYVVTPTLDGADEGGLHAARRAQGPRGSYFTGMDDR